MKIVVLVLVLLFLIGCAAPAVEEPATETTEYITITEQPTTTEEPTTAAPREWPGVPQAYWAILNEPTHFPSPANAFALVDINGDGVLELVMISRSVIGEYTFDTMVGLLTQSDGMAYGLGVGSTHRFGLNIWADGTVYMGISMRDGQNTITGGTYRLAPRATELTQLTDYSIFSRWDDETETISFWYQNTQGVVREISKEEHDRIWQRGWDDVMQFDVIMLDEVGA